MKKLWLLSAAAAAMTLLSCVKELDAPTLETVPDGDEMTITASMDGADTKVFLEYSGSYKTY